MEEYENFFHDKFGYCYYVIYPNNTAAVYNLYVEPEYRRKGHAKRILQYVIQAIRNLGYTGNIWVQVNPRENSIDSGSLEKFYVRMGLIIIADKET